MPRLPHFLDNRLTDGGQLVSHPLPPGRFLVLISVKRLSPPQGHSAVGRIRSTEKSKALSGNWTRDLPACSIVPQPTMLLHSPTCIYFTYYVCIPENCTLISTPHLQSLLLPLASQLWPKTAFITMYTDVRMGQITLFYNVVWLPAAEICPGRNWYLLLFMSTMLNEACSVVHPTLKAKQSATLPKLYSEQLWTTLLNWFLKKLQVQTHGSNVHLKGSAKLCGSVWFSSVQSNDGIWKNLNYQKFLNYIQWKEK
jgi:hypothetical protein